MWKVVMSSGKPKNVPKLHFIKRFCWQAGRRTRSESVIDCRHWKCSFTRAAVQCQLPQGHTRQRTSEEFNSR